MTLPPFQLAECVGPCMARWKIPPHPLGTCESQWSPAQMEEGEGEGRGTQG